MRWMLMAMMIVAVSVSGCRKKASVGTGDPMMDRGVLGVRSGLVDEGAYGMGAAPFSGQEERGQFQPVYFAYDSSTVSDSERAKIEMVAETLRASPGVVLVVEGHCDERGSAEYNLALGERRALAVRAYLVGLGIGADRIQTKSYGEEMPVAMGHNEESWRLNRRAEFVIVR